MTYQEWQTRRDLQLQWEETWKQPHMKHGLSVLQNVALEIIAEGGGDILAVNAITNGRREGFALALYSIGRMGEAAKQPQKTPKPWEYVKPKTVSAPVTVSTQPKN